MPTLQQYQHLSKSRALFVNAQLTIKSVCKMVLQLGLHSCICDLIYQVTVVQIASFLFCLMYDLGGYINNIGLKIIVESHQNIFANLCFCALSPLTSTEHTVLRQYPTILNNSPAGSVAKTIKKLTCMLPMLDFTHGSNRTLFKMATTFFCICKFIKHTTHVL